MNLEKYIRNLEFRERFLMDFAVGATILGGVVTAASELGEPLGLVLIYGGIYSATVSHQYKILNNELAIVKRGAYVKKRGNDIK